jgi:hypothetical protein
MGKIVHAPHLQIPDQVDRHMIESWRAKVSDYESLSGRSNGLVRPPLLIEFRLGNRLHAYHIVLSMRELEGIAFTALTYFATPDIAGLLVRQFVQDHWPNGFVGPVTWTGVEVWNWIAGQGYVAPAPVEWGWTEPAGTDPASPGGDDPNW